MFHALMRYVVVLVSLCALPPLLTIPVAAADTTVISIYSARAPALLQPMLDAYTAKTGVDFNVLYLPDGMAQRLEAEGAATPADIVLTADIIRMAEMDALNIFAVLDSPILNANIPAKWRDDDLRWFGLSARARVAAVSKARVGARVEAGALTRLEDLADAKWRGRICSRAGSHPYNRALLASLVAHAGAGAAAKWAEGFVANLARKPQGNDRAQVSAIHSGRCDVALINTYYYGLMRHNLQDPEQQKWADSVRLVFLNQAERGQHVNITTAAMLATSDKYDAVVAFLEWLTGAEGQNIYSSINYEYPINPKVTPSAELRSWGAFEADDLPIDEIANNAETAQRIIDRVGW